MLQNDLIAALPELYLVCAGMLLLMFGVFRGPSSLRLVHYFALASFLLAFVLVAVQSGEPQQAFSGLFVVDAFGRFMKMLILVGAGATLVMSLGFIEREGMARFEYPVLVVFATLGMLMMASANDLLSLYIGLELQSLSLYVIAAFRRDDLRSTEAGLKYFVLGALSSGLLLYGISLIYGFAGSTSFTALASISTGEAAAGVPIGLIVGIVFVCSGLAFKVSAVPFHMWTPDVYEGAPTPVTAFFATAPKVAAMALFVRVLMGPFGELMPEWQQIVIFVSLASMLLGAFAAINQTNIKRLMAYSSIGHIGYALVGLAAGTEEGVRGVAIYLAIYIVMNLGVFACILCMRAKGRMLEGTEDLKGLSSTHPMIALALMILMFSMTGIPPLAGFFGKYFVFLAAINAELYALAVIGVLSSVVGAFYYLRIIKYMYFDEPVEALERPIGRDLGIVLTASCAAVVFFFLFMSPVLDGAAVAAATFFEG